MANISFYGSHNATYVVEENGEILIVLEVERFLNYKNSGMAQYQCPKNSDLIFLSEYIPDYLKRTLNIKEFDTCYHLNTDVIMDKVYHLEKGIKAKNYVYALHHEAHAAGCFYQSPYQDALVFSFDGGGNDGFFNVYLANRETSVTRLQEVLNPIENHPHIHHDIGFPYMIFAHYLKDIQFECLGWGNLVYPGKIMGLAPYGKVRDEWMDAFMHFYKTKPCGQTYEEKIKELGDKIGVVFDIENRFDGELAYDIAATNQRAFEESFLEVAKPWLEKYPDLPVCIAGGCGLNIILNTRIKKEFNRDVFVGPNPNDCGIAAGVLLHVIRPKDPVDLTYSGTKLLDLDTIPARLQNDEFSHHFTTHHVNMDEIVDDLIEGHIVGVARGRAEHGPRALGNRSILCDPSIPDMKDTLNHKVKHREWYRPFAPVVRLEDVSKYFEWEGESRWMSFCPLVKEEWKDKLSAITHVDGTARVQTVTREQNEFLYDLLTKFNEKRGIGVLLNTSFNVNGKPVLSTVDDAFKIFTKTELSRLLIEDYYFRKNV